MRDMDKDFYNFLTRHDEGRELLGFASEGTEEHDLLAMYSKPDVMVPTDTHPTVESGLAAAGTSQMTVASICPSRL